MVIFFNSTFVHKIIIFFNSFGLIVNIKMLWNKKKMHVDIQYNNFYTIMHIVKNNNI